MLLCDCLLINIMWCAVHWPLELWLFICVSAVVWVYKLLASVTRNEQKSSEKDTQNTWECKDKNKNRNYEQMLCAQFQCLTSCSSWWKPKDLSYTDIYSYIFHEESAYTLEEVGTRSVLINRLTLPLYCHFFCPVILGLSPLNGWRLVWSSSNTGSFKRQVRSHLC